MKAIVVHGDRPGRPMTLEEVAAPPATGKDELRIRVRATAVNRADLLQRRGLYPPPPGASEVLGLECAGEVLEAGAGVTGWAPGDRVMALLPGGGYAQEAVVHAGSAMPVPAALDLTAAGGLPEVFLTVHLNVFEIGRVAAGDTILVHGGGSGIGTAAISLAREAGVRVLVTAGSPAKCARCREHGADAAFDYRATDFAAEVERATGGRGVDLVLDCVGGPYLERNLRCLATGGRLVQIGLMGGATAEIDLALLMRKRAQVIGSTLRARPVEEKAALVRSFVARFGDAIAEGRIAPVVHAVLPLEQAERAHEILKASEHFGKVVLRVP